MAEAKQTKQRSFADRFPHLAWLDDIPTKIVDGRVVVDREAILKRFPEGYDPIEAARGMFAGGPSMTEALLEDRRQDREREERKFRRFD